MLPTRSDTWQTRRPRGDAGAFASVSDSLREELVAHRQSHGVTFEGVAGLATLETNSGFVERRAAPLAALITERLGVESLQGVRVVDLGCGFGALSAFFAFHGARLVGLDINSERLIVGRRVAERHGLDVTLQCQGMEQLEFPDMSFDVAVANNSLCYLVDSSRRRQALQEALRVLVPEGVLVTRNPNRLHPIDQFTGLPFVQLLPPSATVRTASLLKKKRSLCRLQSPSTAIRELRRAGFASVVHHSVKSGSLRPRYLARYTHLTARRPERAHLPGEQ